MVKMINPSITVSPVYTSVACNRTPEIADWNSADLICFGASNAVVIYDKKCKGGDPLTVLSQHSSMVNSVKWLRKPDDFYTEMLSCSADKTAVIWSFVNGAWTPTSTLTGHTDGVTCVHGVYINDNDLVVYTAAIDSSIRVWERQNGTVTLKQTIPLNSGLCLTLHAHMLPMVNKPLLFCALDDYKIHIFAGDEHHRVHMLAGHEDWVRGLDVINVDETTILLASASQDTFIRLWQIQQHVEESTGSKIKVEQKVFSAQGQEWSVKLEAVLAGHEGWVYGVQWHPYSYDYNRKKKVPVYRLLSSSLDKTLIIWGPEDGEEGTWTELVRVGEVGGNGLGFYGSRFGPNGNSFMGHGYNGSFHIWELNKDTNQWDPSVVCGGHFNSVEGVRWEPNHGRYIMSVSTDQTTRVHAPWKRRESDGGVVEWHEISRPQVHGYDLSSLAPVDSVTFVSAAEEKVIRAFRAPHNFVQNFANIVGVTLVEGMKGGPEGASVPSLGLSNKAVFTGDEKQDAEDENDGYFVPVNLTEPPTEETLMQNTLWPEVQKLYGHGYEVFALDASRDGQLVASACRATAQEHAAVLIWETSNWQQIQRLISHQLTVTQLSFSPDSRRLLSVSRDRRWTLYHRQGNLFSVEAATDKSNGVHTRIIWCCAWAHDNEVFGTGSRDGKVCLWSKTDTIEESSLKQHALLSKPLELTTSVTALAFAPVLLEGSRLIATGLETGVIRIYKFDLRDQWTLMKELDKSAAHHLTVKRLTFRPKVDEDDSLLLASCGSDHFVRMYSVIIS